MKILFFCVKFPLASETFILNQIISFIKKGYDVKVLSIYPGDMDKIHDDYLEYDLKSKVHYIFDEDITSKSKYFQFSKRVQYSLKSFALGNMNSFDFNKYGFLSYTLLLPALIGRVASRIESDYIIAHFGPCGVLANCLRSCGILHGKIVTVFHGYDLSATNLLNRYKGFYKRLFNDGDLFLPVSHVWESKLIEMGCDKGKISVIRMGIQIENFSFYPRPFRNEPLKLISVCRLTEKKGLRYAIQACDILNKSGYRFQYDIVGYGELNAELQQLISKYGLEDKVNIIGFQPQSVVKKLLMKSDVFLLPSVTANNGDMEGIPVALMEAMAIGLPVISTFHSGIPELIENDVSGWLCDERDFQAIANILISLLKDQKDLKYIQDNARRKIELSFNQEKEYSQMANLLERLS